MNSFSGHIDSYDNETIGGWIVDPKDRDRIFDVELYVDGCAQGRVRAAFSRPDVMQQGLGTGNNGFYFSLPPPEREGSSTVEVREVLSGEVIGAPLVLQRTASPAFAGLSRTAAAAMVYKPLLAIGCNAIAFKRNVITLEGVYLPPGGNPFGFDVIGEEGVSFQLQQGLHDTGALEYFWFWPNVQWGSWRIEINLALTHHRGSEYKFVFRPHGDARPDCTETLFVPKDLGRWEHLPTGEAMNRVQLYDFAEASPLRAAMHVRAIVDLARRHKPSLDGLKVLDWGCGWGRLARTIAASENFAELWGADIDHDNLAWARDNIPGVRFEQVPLYPPTSLPTDYFDVVYAVSVMTHLTSDNQALWLAEIRRILKPGGIAVLSFHGRTALAFASRFLSERMTRNFLDAGFDDGLDCDHLDAIIGSGYYKNTFQTTDDVRQRWGAFLEVLELVECGVGLQDVAVLAKT